MTTRQPGLNAPAVFLPYLAVFVLDKVHYCPFTNGFSYDHQPPIEHLFE